MSVEEFGAVNTEQFASIPHTLRELPLEPMENPYARVFENFARHLLHGEPLYADGWDCLREVQLANAIYVSGWAEQKVRLPVEEERYLSGLKRRQEEERNR